MHVVDNWDVEFSANIDALGAMVSMHLGSARYSTTGNGLIEIREGLLNLGVHWL